MRKLFVQITVWAIITNHATSPEVFLCKWQPNAQVSLCACHSSCMCMVLCSKTPMTANFFLYVPACAVNVLLCLSVWFCVFWVTSGTKCPNCVSVNVCMFLECLCSFVCCPLQSLQICWNFIGSIASVCFVWNLSQRCRLNCDTFHAEKLASSACFVIQFNPGPHSLCLTTTSCSHGLYPCSPCPLFPGPCPPCPFTSVLQCPHALHLCPSSQEVPMSLAYLHTQTWLSFATTQSGFTRVDDGHNSCVIPLPCRKVPALCCQWVFICLTLSSVSLMQMWREYLYACMCAWVYVCVCVHKHVCEHMHALVFVFLHVCVLCEDFLWANQVAPPCQFPILTETTWHHSTAIVAQSPTWARFSFIR